MTYTIAEVFDDEGFIDYWTVLANGAVVGTAPDESSALALRDFLREWFLTATTTNA